MNLKRLLLEGLSVHVTEDGNDADDYTIVTSTEPDFLSSTVTESDLTTLSSTPNDVTSPPGEEENDKKWVLPVIIGAACLLLVVGVGVTVLVYRKWRCFGLPLPFIRKKLQLAQPIKKVADSVRSSISSTFSSSRGSLLFRDNNKQFRKYAVRLDKKVDGDSDGDVGRDLDGVGERDFSGEFEALKRADLKDTPVTVALKPENVLKNRFSNILPYDRTRVVLTVEGASGNDYVNASYVSGYRKEREFICTQGALKQTVVDFWRMCWETQASAIVMLTKCYEKNQEKCYPYWPSGNTGYTTFGNIKVTLERKTTWRQNGAQGQEANGGLGQNDHLWQVSELIMEKEGETGTKSIIHVVFLSWPDFGVVDPPSSLISFVRNVQGLIRTGENNNDDGKEKGPVVVHCSAGVGRSGVFIAVHQLIQQLEEFAEENDASKMRNKSVNIFQTIAKMRRERMGMVQNLQQYTLVYECLRVLVSDHPNNDEPSVVSNDVIQGSDWGLIYPDAKS